MNSMVSASAKIRLQTMWIRLRAWIKLVFQTVAIAAFLLGLYAFNESLKIYIGGVEFIGHEVPSLFGFTPIETLRFGGLLLMIVGLALCYKWIITGPGTPAKY